MRTSSEKFINSLCERSFLKLWTHPNPKGKKGTELCDCLVVCDPHIVIISVKDNKYRETGDKTGWERWTKRAIDKSTSQIWGAERWLETVESVERHDGRIVTLPAKRSRHYHRIAVALGAHGQVPLMWGDFGKGFVHVCDEYSVDVVFSVLDTITDFVDFLNASEVLVRNTAKLILAGAGIEDLVALYLYQGRSFNLKDSEYGQPDMLVLDSGLWQKLTMSEEFKRMKNELIDSFIWDRLIDYYADELLSNEMIDMHSKRVTNNELALVTMALQPRLYRVEIANAYIEFLHNKELKSGARVVEGYGNCTFVFTIGSSENRDNRVKELELRCLVVRGRFPNTKTVVGIATDRPGTSEVGYSSDIVYLHIPEWNEDMERIVQGIQNDLGYFKNVLWNKH